MERKIKTFKMFKESYLSEFEDETQGENMPEMDDSDNDTTDVDTDVDTDTDTDTTEVEESELVTKIRSIVDGSYMDTFTDMVNGIHGELDEEIDKDEVIDAILDIFQEKIEQVLGEESSGEESLEDVEDEEVPADDENVEDMIEDQNVVETFSRFSGKSIQEKKALNPGLQKYLDKKAGKKVTKEEEESLKKDDKKGSKKIKEEEISKKGKFPKFGNVKK